MAKIIDPDLITAGQEVTVDTGAKTITLVVTGELSTDGLNLNTLYSWLKEQWKTDVNLIKFPFPMVAITVEQFELVSEWDFGDDTSRNLIRDGGWNLKDSGGLTQETFMNLTSLGAFDDSGVDNAYYLQIDGGTPTNIVLTGEVNQAIKIYGDGTHGNFDYTDYFKIYLREPNKTYGFYDLISEQNLTVLENKKYALPLSNGTDLKATTLDNSINAESGSSVGIATEVTFASPDTITGTVTTSEFDTTNIVSGDLIFVQGSENATNDGYFTVDTISATEITTTEQTITTSASESGSITVTEDGVADITPYSGMDITWLTGTGFTAWTIDTLYAAGAVVLDDEINVNSSTLGTWWITPGGGTSAIGTGTATDTGITDWVQFTGERQIGLEWYPYNIIVDGNSGTAEQIYEFIQFSLRQLIDIDRGLGIVRGDTSEELAEFIGDTLKTKSTLDGGVYVDNFLAADTNRVQFVDSLGGTRIFPFVAAGLLLFNDNLTGDSDSVYRVFFTNDDAGDNAGFDYGTTNAITIQDNSDVDIAGSVAAAPSIEFDFDYDGNIQRGAASSETDAPYTAVAIGLSGAQFVVTTGTIVRSTANTINFVAALERNYTNPA